MSCCLLYCMASRSFDVHTMLVRLLASCACVVGVCILLLSCVLCYLALHGLAIIALTCCHHLHLQHAVAVYMYIYIYIYVYTHVCMYIYIYIYTYVYIYIYIYVYTHIHTYIISIIIHINTCYDIL